MLFRSGEYLEYCATHKIRCLEPGHAFEDGIDVQEAIVDRCSRRIANDFVYSEAVKHLIEQCLVLMLALTQRFFLFLLLDLCIKELECHLDRCIKYRNTGGLDHIT